MARSMFDGRDLLKASDAELIEIRRHKMGMVFQHFALLPHLTVLEQRRLSAGGPGRRPGDARGAGARGDRSRRADGPRALSIRASSRAASSSASASPASLAVEPEIWFLDEPFSALDPLIRREMQDELLRLQGVLKKTIVFITHDFDEAIRLADRIAIMKDGEVIQIGTPEELVLQPGDRLCRRIHPRCEPRQGHLGPQPDAADHARCRVMAARVAANAKIASFAAAIVGAGQPFAVIDGTGSPIGEVTPRAVIDLLAGRDRAESAA